MPTFEFIAANQDYFHFLKALFFILLFTASRTLRQLNPGNPPYARLGLFGLMQAVAEICDLLALSFPETRLLFFSGLLATTASYTALMDFGRVSLAAYGYPQAGNRLFTAFILILLAGVLPGPKAFYASVHIIAVIPPTLCASWVFHRQACLTGSTSERRIFIGLSGCILLFGLSSPLFAPLGMIFSVPQADTEELVIRTTLAGGIVKVLISLWLAWLLRRLGTNCGVYPDDSDSLKVFRAEDRFMFALLLILLLFGWMAVWKVGADKAGEEIGEFRRAAFAISSCINPERIANLAGDASDARSSDYIRLGEQLENVMRTRDDIVSVCIFGHKGNRNLHYLNLENRYRQSGSDFPQKGTAGHVCEGRVENLLSGQPHYMNIERKANLLRIYTAISAPLYTPQSFFALGTVFDISGLQGKVFAQRQMPILIVMGFSALVIIFFAYRHTIIMSGLESKGREKQFRDMFTNHSAVMLLLDPENGDILDYNTAAGSFYGYSREIMKDMNISELNPGSFDQVRETLVSAVELGGDSSLFRHKLADGSIRDVEMHSSPIRVGRKTILFSIIHDVTERVAAENALKESEELFRQLAENVEVVIWIGTNREMIYVNPAYERIWGRSRDELYSEPDSIWESVSAENRQTEKAERKMELALSGRYSDEYMISRPDGQSRWILANVFPIHDDNGRIVKQAGIAMDVTARKNLEKLLAERQAELSTLLDGIPGYAFYKNTDGVYITANEAFCKALGRDREEIRGVTDADLFPGKLADKYRADDLLIIEGRFCRLDVEEEMPDGRNNLYVLTRKLPVTDKNGKIIGVVGVGFDITDRKSAERELEIAREKYSKAFQLSSSAMAVMSLETEAFIEVNDAFTSLTGYQNGEIIGRSAVEMGIVDHRQVQIIQSRMESRFQDVEETEIRITTRKGDFRDVLFTAKKLGLAGKDYLFMVLTDITARKEMEKTLHSLLEYNRGLIEANLDPLVTISPEGKIRDVNMAMEEMSGRGRRELMGTDFSEYFTNPADARKAYELTFKKGSIRDFELELLSRDGHITPILYNAAVFRGESGGIEGVFAAIRDISRRKALEIQLMEAKIRAETADKAKSDFLANMSHEIRTPMNAVLGFAELLKSRVTDEKSVSYLSAIDAAGKTLLELINDILDLSKIEAGRMDLKNEPLRIHRFMREIRAFFTPKADEKKLNFSVGVAPEIPNMLILDELRLRQVLTNLIGNAIKFTDRGEIAVKLENMRMTATWIDLRLSVRDTGIGIPHEYLEDIFDSFTQVCDKGKKKYGGTGLGLAITKRLVDMMNGTVRVESEPGAGSKFIVELPRVGISEDVTDMEGEYDRLDSSAFMPSTIVVADDEELNRNLLVEYLSLGGHKILIAATGREVLEIVSKFRPTLILMDVKMPEMSGIEATRIIKADPALRDVPIIIISASVFEKGKNEIEHLIEGWLTKPLSREILFKALKKVLPGARQGGEKTPESKAHGTGTDEVLLKVQSMDESRLDELIALLDGELLQTRNEALKHKKITVIEQFAESLEKTGEEYETEAIATMGKNLKKAIDVFDVVEMNRILEDYGRLADNLRVLLRRQAETTYLEKNG